jgi:spore maturation protein CgeB
MRIAIFCHSLLSDWNHGNAHFLRGVVGELISRGHQVSTYEPRDAWSAQNLVKEVGEDALHWAAREAYRFLDPVRYDGVAPDLERALDGVDVALVHEWNDPELVRQIGARRARGGRFCLLFHDTHHRMVTDPASMHAYDLSAFDGILAFGKVLADLYERRGFRGKTFVWHEAVDPRVFRPVEGPHDGDVVFVGNWGDEERSAELREFLLEPARELGLKARMHGVRFPPHALDALAIAGVEYGGFVPNFRVPRVFSGFKLTVHIPRSPYVRALPGIPTIRPFEALGCGIPLVSSWWDDSEELFRVGRDFLMAKTGREMKEHIRMLLGEPSAARQLALQGRRTVLARHTCGHRVDELLAIVAALRPNVTTEKLTSASKDQRANA